MAENNNVIPAGLRADIMRKCMENKNILSEKGSMYVGTGNYEEFTVNDKKFKVYETAEIKPGADSQILAFSGTEIIWDEFDPDAYLLDGSLLPNKIAVPSATIGEYYLGSYINDVGDRECDWRQRVYKHDIQITARLEILSTKYDFAVNGFLFNNSNESLVDYRGEDLRNIFSKICVKNGYFGSQGTSKYFFSMYPSDNAGRYVYDGSYFTIIYYNSTLSSSNIQKHITSIDDFSIEGDNIFVL